MDKSIDPQSRMRGYIQLVATGPELSKSLNADQAEDGLSLILKGQIDPVRAGIFLIALRMKRETDEENIGALNALNKSMHSTSAGSPEVLAIADPFNGYLRGLPATPFLPAVFAACGLPAYFHGLHSAGPKYGITGNMVLAAAGKRVDRTVEEAARCLVHPDIGWAYLDQKYYIPELHDLVDLRDAMVKRSCISTLEVVLKPVSGSARTHLMTGFVHKAYPPVYAALARHAGFDSAMIIRGVEGGSIPSLSQLSRYFGYQGDDEMQLHKLAPREVGIEQEKRMVPIPEQFETLMEQTGYKKTGVLNPVIEHIVESGLDALANKPGSMLDSLIYGAAIGLSHTGVCENLSQGAAKAREAIADGEALRRFNAG